VRNCLTDEGRPLEVGLQERTSNRLRRLWSKAMVVSAKGKGPARPGQVSGKKRTARKPLVKCRKLLVDVKTAALLLLRDRATTVPVYGRSGIRHERWPELAMRRISGTWEPAITMLTEKPQVETPRGREYGCVIAGTGQLVVAMKSPIKGWSEGAVSRSLIQ
jgi:hypothetical protein